MWERCGQMGRVDLALDLLVVGVFDSERQANAAAVAIENAWEDGGPLAYSVTVIVRLSEGNSTDGFTIAPDLLDATLGMGCRTLLIALADSFRALKGDSNDADDRVIQLANAGIDRTFVDEVAGRLFPGRAAMLAEIDEDGATATDALVECRGGMILRCVRREIADAQIANELSALHGEIRSLQQRLLQGLTESQTELQEKLELARTRLETIQRRARRHADSIKREAEARIVWLQERAARAEGQSRSRLERVADEVRLGYVNRATKLTLACRSAGNPKFPQGYRN
jgi:hypothetical protein